MKNEKIQSIGLGILYILFSVFAFKFLLKETGDVILSLVISCGLVVVLFLKDL